MAITDFTCELFKVEIVEGRILLVTITRPKALNSIPVKYGSTFIKLWEAYEEDENLICAVLTGEGKVFCAGADLKDWLATVSSGDGKKPKLEAGFLGISDRSTRKPIIAALNGSSYGGGTETVVNCDLAVAVKTATLSLPEVRRGVTALAGALPRIGRQLGLKRANELALVGEPITAHQALEWGLLNKVVDKVEDVVPAALEYARKIALGSPEAISGSLISIRRGFEDTKLSVSEASKLGSQLELKEAQEMDNIGEGLVAFKEKRAPKWSPAKLSKL